MIDHMLLLLDICVCPSKIEKGMGGSTNEGVGLAGQEDRPRLSFTHHRYLY